MVIDTHQHFWMYQKDKHAWIDESMKKIQKDFLPENLKPILEKECIDGCIAVQADQTMEETFWLAKLASENKFIKAVIGWIDLCAEDISSHLETLKPYQIIKGFRHILQAEKPEFMISPEFFRGIEALYKMQYCYEILIYPHQLSAATVLVQQFPNMRFVLDHIAKPSIKTKSLYDWKLGIESLAKNENVFCKISGMVTEADWNHWQIADFNDYLDVVTNAFGINRLMYGSDWPVCLLAADYTSQYGIVRNYFKNFSSADQSKVFGENASVFYRI